MWPMWVWTESAPGFDEIIRKRHFLSTKANEPEECWPGAAGTISATTEERLTEKVAYTEGEEPNVGLGQIPDGIFEHLDQAMPEATSTPRLLVMGTINSLLKNSGLSVCHFTTVIQTNIMHRNFRTGDEWLLYCKSSLSVIQSQPEGPLIGAFPQTMSDVFLPVPGLLQLPWGIVTACVPVSLLSWTLISPLGGCLLGERAFMWCLLSVRLYWVLCSTI